jgi:1-acyl-sn-glycerol-3-phosphate acyltransferase
MGAIPIDRTRNRKSADLAAELIEDGWSILIFPEEAGADGWGQPFRGGAAYLSVRTEAPVVPIHSRAPAGSWAGHEPPARDARS